MLCFTQLIGRPFPTVPPEIILGKFTEKRVQDGFTVVYWDQLKQNVTKLYKELHK